MVTAAKKCCVWAPRCSQVSVNYLLTWFAMVNHELINILQGLKIVHHLYTQKMSSVLIGTILSTVILWKVRVLFDL